MYLSSKAVSWAVRELRRGMHPFLGITFLACKKIGLPVGETMPVRLDAVTKKHLEDHHQLDSRSRFYFQPFKSTQYWVVQKYPSSGLQAINTQTFGDIFLHKKRSQNWGFKNDYVEKIIEIAGLHSKVPLSAIAIWTSKKDIWGEDVSLSLVVEKFLMAYCITPSERSQIFTPQNTPNFSVQELFANKPADLKSIAYDFGMPPDAPTETEGTLAVLHLRDIGPAKSFDLEFGERLTLISGDNGLGKSFLLDVAWWAITGKWADKPAFPFVRPRETNPTIEFEVRSVSNQPLTGSSTFDWGNHSWITQGEKPSVSALCIYARVNSFFAVSDETRSRLQVGNPSDGSFFASDEVWNGKPGEIEGLVRDWVNWQHSRNQDAFSMLTDVLKCLSPADLGILAPGEPVRIPGDPRLIPTIKHPYGEVPIMFSSAGVQSILLLAYLIIWSWREHALASRQIGEDPLRKMIIVVDEIEAHLHPRWQRTILPALMNVGRLLSEELEMQIIVSTHSPMVLASIENDFAEKSDVLRHLTLEEANVVLKPLEFQKYGDVSAWLTSPVFGLQHARSYDAEKTIEKAKAVQLNPEPDVSAIRRISNELRRLLSPDDPFWPRWTFFAERFGVDL